MARTPKARAQIVIIKGREETCPPIILGEEVKWRTGSREKERRTELKTLMACWNLSC